MIAVLGVDIGGTKIASGLVVDGVVTQVASSPTTLGLAGLTDQLNRIINSYPIVDRIGLSVPGKLVGPFASVIFPGSARNLEVKSGELDHVDWRSLIKDSINVTVKNDAVCQLIGGAQLLIQANKIPHFTPCQMGYIGPGTGLGGGIATSLNPPEFISDGHLYDMMLCRDPHDTFSPAGKWVMAENVVSGRAFKQLSGHGAHEATPDDVAIGLTMGRYIGQMIHRVQSGDWKKHDSSQNWTTADVLRAKSTDVWLLGGSLGTHHPMCRWLIDGIRQFGLSPTTRILRIPNGVEAALKGVAYLSLLP